MDRVRTLCVNLHNIAKLDGGLHTVMEEGDVLYESFIDVLVSENLAHKGRFAAIYREMTDLSERLARPIHPSVEFETQLFARLAGRLTVDMARFRSNELGPGRRNPSNDVSPT